MPLVSIVETARRAQREGWAVPLLGAVDSLTLDAVFEAAEAERSPVILGVYASECSDPRVAAVAAYARQRAADTDLPVSLMLDHGPSLELCHYAIGLGFTDVMFDGSKLPIEENIASTRELVERAHPLGIGVEGELGHVAFGSDYSEFAGRREGFTDPEMVPDWARETGADLLAIAFGTAHGIYTAEPRLDLDLVCEIASRVPEVSLVLHGGSGLSAEQFQGSVAAGIAKVNVSTELFVRAGEAVREAARADTLSYWDLTNEAKRAFREACAYHIRVLGASGRA
jgi:fructose-bisphosphate aldolase, class II